MPSIMITGNCNNHCKYCFANDSLRLNPINMDMENFLYSLDFLCKGSKQIGIIGGEPTLHPKFDEIISKTIARQELETIVIYTNGHDIAKYTNLIDDKRIQILINCNSPEDIGHKEFENLRENIKYLNNNLKNTDFRLGYNIYDTKCDWEYIINLCKEFHHNHLRIAIAVPDFKNKKENIIDFHKRIKSSVIQMLIDFNNADIIPHFDCNAIPVCILNNDEIKIMADIQKNIKEKHSTEINLLTGNRTCTPQILINPDLSVTRCFANKEYKKVRLKDFKTYNDLYKYFYTNIDIYTNVIPFIKECTECSHKISNCSVCSGFKTQYIDNFKEKITEFI